MFDPPHGERIPGATDDVSLLARRRAAQLQATAAPAITVNFPGFADLLRAPTARVANGPADLQDAPAVLPHQGAPLPQMPLATFCQTYSLSFDIEQKLHAIQLSGPHVLSLISNTDLRAEAMLSIGELASVRDAELRWRYSLM